MAHEKPIGWRRVTALIAVLLLAVSACFFPIYASSPEIVFSPYAVVYNVENGIFVYEKDADAVIAPASTTKIMTAILALEHYAGALDTEITVIYSAIRGLDGTVTMNLKVGEVVTVRQLLYGMLVLGANDAAQVLAYEIGKAESMFAALMTKRAAELGAVSTVYQNATGLDHALARTTARDVARIAAYARSLPVFMEICSTVRFEMPATNKSDARSYWTRNHLLSTHNQIKYRYTAAEGMSSGYTDMGGYCLVSSAGSSFHYIAVAMGGGKNKDGDVAAYYDVKNLLSWAQTAFEKKKILSADTVLCEIPVTLSREFDHVTLVPAEAVYTYLPKELDAGSVERTVVLDTERLEAPVEKGRPLGTVTLSVNGETVGEVRLVAGYSVHRSEVMAVRNALRRAFGHPLFYLILFLLVLAAVLFGFVRFYLYMKKAKIKK